MNVITEGTLLWQPSEEDVAKANLTAYMAWLRRRHGLLFEDYPALWQWSVDHIDDFWLSIWEYFDVQASVRGDIVLGNASMPGAQWFPDARLNYAENIFARCTDRQPMLLYQAEESPLQPLSWQEIYDQVHRVVDALLGMGVEPGDRVVAYLPNSPEAIVAMLATASIGAVWSSCAPDFGTHSVLDRFMQIEPKVLIAVDGYRYGGRLFDRRNAVRDLQKSLPTLAGTILVTHISGGDGARDDMILWKDIQSRPPETAAIEFARLPFDHPLWVLYSSGTTGLPKPIVQGHGGILLEHLKSIALHNDIKPEDRFFWYSSTGWMMWNYTVGSLLSGCTAILYNGSPAYPDMNVLWRLAEQSGMTYFGTSAAYIGACVKAGSHPNRAFDLSRLRAVGSTGSPLTADGFAWVYENVNRRLALESLSGGTDLCTAFVGGARTQPIYAGELQGASLGASVRAFDDGGNTVLNQVGELVITRPMPSMPLYFWNDPEDKRYRESYFEMYPGIWRHGDWIKINDRGGCVIYGRSDSTINRHGIRMGTSEIYRVVESLPEVMDSLIVDLELLGRDSYLPLFVVLRMGAELDSDLIERIKQRLRTDISPRHVPDDVYKIEQVPYTLSGKKMEVPIRKILLGEAVERAVNVGAMRNPDAVGYFEGFAERLTGKIEDWGHDELGSSRTSNL